MADLLLELFSEEIPARMQVQAAKDMERLVVGALSDRGLLFEGVKAFSGPRRLTLAITGLPVKQPDVSEELKGPKIDAPQSALDGFLRKSGLTKDQLKIEKTPKGDVYLAVIARKGRETAEVLAEVLPETFAKLPWPKSMRFPGSPVRWVRPLHGIVCTFDGEVVPFEFAGVKCSNTTMGHRFLSDGRPIAVRHFDDYIAKLRAAHVVLDAEERKAIIFEELKEAAFVRGLELIPDEGLLDEVSGLAEWPVVLIGAIEDDFMDVPPEILQTSMRTHQKYFSLRDPKTGKMANRFAVIANMVASDGGKEIIAGNERVLRARLSDAKFFWDQDRKDPLDDRVFALENVVFHAGAGTMLDRTMRIKSLALAITDIIEPSPNIANFWEKATRAAHLSKADLVTGVVSEFPELQGIMGGYYAQHEKEDVEVVNAVRDHYRPLGPNDRIPHEPVTYVVALADKIDVLVSLWRAGEKPTGSGDAFGLRRAGLGIIRIILENQIRLGLFYPILTIIGELKEVELREKQQRVQNALSSSELGEAAVAQIRELIGQQFDIERRDLLNRIKRFAQKDIDLTKEVMQFLADRLKVALREKGTRHDLIDAVFSLGNEDDLVRLVARVEALQSFLKTDEGANLLAGYKRAVNILKAEEKKDKTTFDGAPDAALLSLPAEKALAEALVYAETSIAADVKAEKFVEAMGVMAKLRAPVDAFFDKVKVNDADPRVRENRLKLLSRLRGTLHQVADFSKIEG